MIDRRVIEAAWARVAHQLDPIHGDEEAEALLRDRVYEAPGIRDAINHIELVNRTEGGAVDAMGYGFVRDELIWRRASECVYQARALQQLCRWWSLNPEDAVALGDVVVRQTFSTSLSFATPQHLAVEPVHFLVIPHAYTELLMLSAKALDETLCGGALPDGWTALRSHKGAISAVAPPAMRQLIARLLTDHAFHPLESGDNPVAKLQAAGEWFATDEDADAPGAMQTHLSYAALDFAIAHELGHRVIHFAKPDTPPGPMLEEASDLIAIRLFAGSWGWRDDVFEGCPLGDGGRILLGPIWFFYSAQLLFLLRAALAARVREIAPGTPAAEGLVQPDRHLSEIVDRWTSQKTLLAKFADGLEQFDAPVSVSDAEVLNLLADALESLTEAVPRWIVDIPPADIRSAAEMPTI